MEKCFQKCKKTREKGWKNGEIKSRKASEEIIEKHVEEKHRSRWKGLRKGGKEAAKFEFEILRVSETAQHDLQDAYLRT